VRLSKHSESHPAHHKAHTLTALSGMRVEFLPPYSPDYNPIELAFSKFKAHIRSREAEFRALDQDEEEMEIHLFLIDGIFSVTGEDARGYFRHCEYI